MGKLDATRLGALAVERGLVTVEQLLTVVCDCAREGDESGVGLVARLRDVGLLTPDQVEELLGADAAEGERTLPDGVRVDERGDESDTLGLSRRDRSLHERDTLIGVEVGKKEASPAAAAPDKAADTGSNRNAKSRARRIIEETRVGRRLPVKRPTGKDAPTIPPEVVPESKSAEQKEKREPASREIRRTPVSLITLPGEVSVGDTSQRRDGRYIIGQELGRGGMGLVRVAEDLDLGRKIAIKTLLAGTDADERLIRALINEARTTGQLEHPNIIPIHEIGLLSTGEVFYTMKLLGNQSLRDVVAGLCDAEPAIVEEFTQVRMLTIVQQLCMALHYAHSRGVIHRDVKPENVLIGAFGEVHLMDWGIAKIMGRSTPLEGTSFASDGFVAGTPTYMPPEQARGDYTSIDHRSDIYSLGVILYEVLALCAPHEGTEKAEDLAAAKEAPVAPPSERSPERRIAPELDAICLRALAFDPNDRYQDARSIWRDIEELLEGTRERERLRQRAAFEVSQGVAAAARYQELLAEQERLTDAVEAAERRATPWDPEDVRQRLWRQKNRVIHMELAVGRSFAEAVKFYNRALGYDPEHTPARVALSGLYESRSQAASRKHDLATMIYFGDLQREVTGADEGQGRLTVRSYPSGAEVHLIAAESLDKEIDLSERTLLGLAPIHEVALNPGGYMIVSCLEGYRETYMPVVVRPSETSALLVRLHPSSVDVPLVGKDEELGRLRVLLRNVVDRGMPRSVLISGPSGIGKSRLLGAFDDYVQDLPEIFLYIQTECRRLLRWVPFSAFADLLRYRAGIQPADSPDGARERIEEMVAYAMVGLPGREALTDEQQAAMVDLASRLQAMPGLTTDLAAQEGGVPGQLSVERRTLFDAVYELFELLSQQRPIIMYVRHMQHMDRMSRELLEELLSRLSSGSLLLVGTASADEAARDPLRSFPFHERLSLQGLRREGVAQFLREILKGPVSDDLVYRVHRFTSGNPFAVESTLRMLIEERRLEIRGGDVCLVPSAAPLLQGAFDLAAEVERRLRVLSPVDRRAIEGAAVVGEAFWPGALRALGVPDPGDVVSRLVKSEIVTRRPLSRFADSEELSFSQNVLRDVIHASIPEEERRRLHGLVVPWLEARPERGASWLAAMAEHLDGAGRRREAAACHGELAKAATAISSHCDALLHCERAVELCDDAADKIGYLERSRDTLAVLGKDDEAAEVALAIERLSAAVGK